MAKVKVPRKSVSLDMTAMCDMAFLLLNFFILTAKFKPEDPVTVDTPGSVSETLLPDKDLMVISIDKDGRVFFGVSGQFVREEMVRNFASKYKVPLSEADVKGFSLLSTFGVEAMQLPGLLKLSNEDKNKPGVQGGVPTDSLNNQLSDWIAYARYANTKINIDKGLPDLGMKVAVKGDKGTPYPVVKRVIATLQDQNINRINLITNLEGKPGA